MQSLTKINSKGKKDLIIIKKAFSYVIPEDLAPVLLLFQQDSYAFIRTTRQNKSETFFNDQILAACFSLEHYSL